MAFLKANPAVSEDRPSGNGMKNIRPIQNTVFPCVEEGIVGEHTNDSTENWGNDRAPKPVMTETMHHYRQRLIPRLEKGAARQNVLSKRKH